MINKDADNAKSAKVQVSNLFPVEIYEILPEPLNSLCKLIDERHSRDIFLLSTFPVIAGHLNHVLVDHRDKHYSPHMFVLIVSRPASGKGILTKAKLLGKSLLYDMTSSDKRRTFFIPGNISSRAFYDILRTNDATGTIFETELDSMLNANKQDWGNFSDIFRKSFHHETLSIGRKDGAFTIENPRLSICLSGTPDQFIRMFPNVDDGLFSRFAFYLANPEIKWESHRPSKKSRQFDNQIANSAEALLQLYIILSKREEPLRIILTDDQWNLIDQAGEKRMLTLQELGINEYFQATNKRLPIIILRIIACLSVLRKFKNEPEKVENMGFLTPEEIDVKTALEIGNTLVRHSLTLFKEIPKVILTHTSDQRFLNFYDALPEEFSTKLAVEKGKNLDISERTVKNWLPKNFNRISHGKYKKTL